MTNERQIKAVAEAIYLASAYAVSHGLVRNKFTYLAKAAIDASDAQYIKGLVGALNQCQQVILPSR